MKSEFNKRFKGGVTHHCLKLGLVRGSPEWNKEFNAEKWRRKTPEQIKQHNLGSYNKRKERMKNDVAFAEKERERNRIRKQKQRETNKEYVNERQREIYRRGGDDRRKSVNDGKRKRDPTIGLVSIERDVRLGKRSARELIDRTRAAIEQLIAQPIRGTREKLR